MKRALGKWEGQLKDGVLLLPQKCFCVSGKMLQQQDKEKDASVPAGNHAKMSEGGEGGHNDKT
jgi:hypothetical protein